ncbi:hypothetical protein GF352_00725 [archaeon]|nr:hypothetical protein [archaeon]
MTLQQLLSGTVINPEQELIHRVTSQDVVIRIEEPSPSLKELIKNNNAGAKVCNGSYVQAILYTLTREANELIIVNNNEHPYHEKRLKRIINSAMNDPLVKQVIKHYKKTPEIKIINLPNY